MSLIRPFALLTVSTGSHTDSISRLFGIQQKESLNVMLSLCIKYARQDYPCSFYENTLIQIWSIIMLPIHNSLLGWRLPMHLRANASWVHGLRILIVYGAPSLQNIHFMELNCFFTKLTIFSNLSAMVKEWDPCVQTLWFLVE